MKSRILPTLLILGAAIASAEDTEYLEAVARAQRDRPAVIGSAARIAPEGEPGTPLIIHGQVFRADGRTPAPDVVVFGYHTDNTGVYNRQHAAHTWRLRGWARTDRDGRFEFRTIRPGAYPGHREPAHVHLTVFGTDMRRGSSGGLLFLDDPILSEKDKRASASEGMFGSARPVVTRAGVQHVDLNLRISEKGQF